MYCEKSTHAAYIKSRPIIEHKISGGFQQKYFNNKQDKL